MPKILLESGGSLLSVLGPALALETGIGGVSYYFNCAELLSIDHRCNFWGDAFNYSSSDVYNIKGRVTGSYENVSGVWDGMSGLVGYTQTVNNLYLNGVSIGYGRISSLSFDKGTDVGYKTYSASLIIDRHAGSGLYSNSGYLPATGQYYTGVNQSDLLESYFTSATGKYIKAFSLTSQTSFESSGRYTRTKNTSFSLDRGIEDEFGANPNDYATHLIRAAKNSYGNAEIVTAIYPNYYTSGGSISRTNQEFDTKNFTYSFSETFDFQTGLPYVWNYSHALQLNNSTISVSENGIITSSQKSGTFIAAANAGWNSISGGIYNRVSDVFSSYTGSISYTGACTLFNYPEQSSISRDLYEGSIKYNYSYSNSPFISTGYLYSYSDEVSLDEEGYITVSENGELAAIRNIRPSGFNMVYSGYLSRTEEIYNRLNSLYNSSTGSLRTCNISGFNLVSTQNTYREYEGIVSYQISYTDNPGFRSHPLFYGVKVEIDDQMPTHMVNYVPISYSNVIAQRSSQSTRGVFTNSINIYGKSGASLSDLITGALGYVQKPTGASDVYAADYGYRYDPLNKNFSLNLVYNYTRYRGPNDYLI
jgi:hypothetical protein